MVKIFLDGADVATMREFHSRIMGYTTNPSLMRKAAITDYKRFAQEVLWFAEEKPVSFEVFADDLNEMQRQSEIISNWGENVYVKIPITNSQGISTHDLIKSLDRQSIKVNVTAVMAVDQLSVLGSHMGRTTPAIISVFAGRIADTGVDPIPIINYGKMRCAHLKKVDFLWASAREVFNVRQAEIAGCDIITLSPELVRKMDLFGKDLAEYSLETVRQFHDDAKGLIL